MLCCKMKKLVPFPTSILWYKMLQRLYFYCVAKCCANFQFYQESISEINLAKLKTAFRENLCWLCFLAQHAVPNKIASQLYIFSQLKHAMTFNQRMLRKPEVVSHEVYSNTFKCPTVSFKRADNNENQKWLRQKLLFANETFHGLIKNYLLDLIWPSFTQYKCLKMIPCECLGSDCSL